MYIHISPLFRLHLLSAPQLQVAHRYLQARFESDFAADQPLDYATLIMRSGAATSAPASESVVDTDKSHSSAHSGSEYSGAGKEELKHWS